MPQCASSILDGRLFINGGLAPLPPLTLRFRDNRERKAHFINQLLLYDRIIIPTADCGIVPVLIDWLGFDGFFRLLQSNAIQIVRPPVLMYRGNGAGLCTFTINEGDVRKFEWDQEAQFGDSLYKSLDLQLNHLCPKLTSVERDRIIDGLNNSLVDFLHGGLPNIHENVLKESYRDIQKSPLLISHAFALSRKRGAIELTKLPGVGSGQGRVGSADKLSDTIDLVLKVAQVNLDLCVSGQLQATDILVPDGTDYLLAQKLVRANISTAKLDGFLQVLELHRIPDLGQAVVSGRISLGKVLDIRESKDGRKFREWLLRAKPVDAADLQSAFVESLSVEPKISSMPVRLIRFVATTVLPGAVGLAASAFDSFFLDRLFTGYQPKFFINRLQKLLQ